MVQVDVIVDKMQKLIDEPYCCDDLALVCESWLSSVDTDQFEDETEKLLMELEEDILPIDDLIHYCEMQRPDWFSSGEEADKYLKHAWDIKSAGAEYCDCGACKLALEVLTMLGDEE